MKDALVRKLMRPNASRILIVHLPNRFRSTATPLAEAVLPIFLSCILPLLWWQQGGTLPNRKSVPETFSFSSPASILALYEPYGPLSMLLPSTVRCQSPHLPLPHLAHSWTPGEIRPRPFTPTLLIINPPGAIRPYLSPTTFPSNTSRSSTPIPKCRDRRRNRIRYWM